MGGPLTPATSWGAGDRTLLAEDGGVSPAAAAVLARYRPPIEVTADMLVVAAFCASRPLRRAFPDVPFLSIFGRTLLLVWFSRITAGCAHDSSDRRWCEAACYHEVTAVVPVGPSRQWRRWQLPALFAPEIRATSARSTVIARAYWRMPKLLTSIRLCTMGSRFEALELDPPDHRHGADAHQGSRVQAVVLGSGALLGTLLGRLWPVHRWRVRFPAGTEARGSVRAGPRVHLAWIRHGRLGFSRAWCPSRPGLVPLGLYAPGLRMLLER